MRALVVFLIVVFVVLSSTAAQVGVRDDEGAVRKVVADYADSWNKHDMQAFSRVFTDDVDYVNIAGRHWKGVQENVAEHAALFQNRLKNVVQTPTSVQIRFVTPDVALVHTTWDATGWSRLNGEPVPVLKEITTMVVVKSKGKWLISAFQNTERSFLNSGAK